MIGVITLNTIISILPMQVSVRIMHWAPVKSPTFVEAGVVVLAVEIRFAFSSPNGLLCQRSIVYHFLFVKHVQYATYYQIVHMFCYIHTDGKSINHLEDFC